MAEKFSRFRDLSTGIQVFLTPVSTGSQSIFSTIFFPFLLILAFLRGILILPFAVFAYVAPTCSFTKTCAKIVLLLLGLRVKKELVSKSLRVSSQVPGSGDLIICNHSSWIDVLVLIAWSNPTFLLPVVQSLPPSPTTTTTSSSSRKVSSSSSSSSVSTRKIHSKSNQTLPVIGWIPLPWYTFFRYIGYPPPSSSSSSSSSLAPSKPLETLLSSSQTHNNNPPIVIFPELTTSNNRGLLCFGSNVFPSTKSNTTIWIVSIRYDSPTSTSSGSFGYNWVTPTFSIPFSLFTHFFKLLLMVPQFHSVSFRISLSKENTIPVDSNDHNDQEVSEVFADCMSSISRLKRTNLGWQDKLLFLEMIQNRK